MITKIEIDKNGKKTIYEVKDEAVVEKELGKIFDTIHQELASSLEEIDKAMKWFEEVKMPKFAFPDFEFPKFTFPEIKISFPKLEGKKETDGKEEKEG